MSESEDYARMLKEEAGRRYEDRKDARRYILRQWEHLGYTEDERDEIIACLGLTEAELSKNLDWNEGQSLSRGGFRASMGKAAMPRTPPTRGQ